MKYQQRKAHMSGRRMFNANPFPLNAIFCIFQDAIWWGLFHCGCPQYSPVNPHDGLPLQCITKRLFCGTGSAQDLPVPEATCQMIYSIISLDIYTPHFPCQLQCPRWLTTLYFLPFCCPYANLATERDLD